MTIHISPDLLSAATVAVRDCMGARPGEQVLVVTDEPLRTIAYALRQAAARGASATTWRRRASFA